MSLEWTAARCASVTAFCDAIFAGREAKADEHGFWARKASDFGIDVALMGVLGTVIPEPARSGLVGLLDGFAASSPEAALGVGTLQRIVLTLCYGLPDAQGRNPNWPALGYPGPRKAAPKTAKPITPFE